MGHEIDLYSNVNDTPLYVQVNQQGTAVMERRRPGQQVTFTARLDSTAAPPSARTDGATSISIVGQAAASARQGKNIQSIAWQCSESECMHVLLAILVADCKATISRYTHCILHCC